MVANTTRALLLRAPPVSIADGSRQAATPRRRGNPLLVASATLGTPFAAVAADLADPSSFVEAAFPLLAADAALVASPVAAGGRPAAPIYVLTNVKGETSLVGVWRVRRSRSAVAVTLRVVAPGWAGAGGGAATDGEPAAVAAAARAAVGRRGSTVRVVAWRPRRLSPGRRGWRYGASSAASGRRPICHVRVQAVPQPGGRDGGGADAAAAAAHFLAVTVEGVVTALGRRFHRADCGRLYRSLDGGCNNLVTGTMGATATEMRQLPSRGQAGRASAAAADNDDDDDVVDDDDGPTGAGRPSARAISSALSLGPAGAAMKPPRNARRLNDLTWAFAQALDHDLSHSGAPSAGPYAEAMPIAVPADDPVFEGGATLRFFRTYRARRPRASPAGRAGRGGRPVGWVAAPSGVVPNELTSWIDASHVYGGDRVRAAALRTGRGGRLAASGAGGRYLPLNGAGPGGVGVTLGAASLAPSPAGGQVVAGDGRAGENVLLTALHTVWLRAHNRWAAAIAAALPAADDEAVYQLARKAVGAAQAKITYEEWLPAVLGPAATPCAGGAYNASVDARVDVFFSTAAFRLGHTLVSDRLARRDAAGRPLPALPLAATFFRPPSFLDSPAAGIDALLRGAAAQVAGEVDVHIVRGLRDLLFGGRGRVGTDLFALNIQRGRDHRLPSYNEARAAYGLRPAASFAHITAHAPTAARLAAAYGGELSAVDAFVGGLAEDHAPGGSVGPLFAAALLDQFHRLAVGDRLFYTRPAAAFPPALVAAVPELGRLGRGGRWGLADLLVATTGVTAGSLPRGGIFFAGPPAA